MTRDGIVKNIGWQKPVAKKRKDQPRRKWREAVIEDLEKKDVINWKRIAKNREWEKLTKQWA